MPPDSRVVGTASAPVEMLLSRLDKVRRCGRGWIARCPAHEDSSASLSVAEGNDGRCLAKCFAGCDLHAIVRALGIEIADLFPERIRDTSPEGRAAMREAHRQSGWAAALNVLAREAAIVAIAGRTIAQGQVLNADDAARLQVALDRIEGAREVLA
jgi:hypothetical protein